MKQGLMWLVAIFFWVIPCKIQADVSPVVGVSLYGGAERGTDGNAGGIGGTELLGILPVGRNWGLQGSLGYVGRSDTHRFDASLGPLFSYQSGKLGLFVDYEFKNSELADVNPAISFLQDKGGRNNHFFFLRGVWAHFFQNFDLVLSYTQPVHHTQNSTALEFDAAKNPSCFPKKDLTINELKGVIRYYPTSELELDGGLLVNSFAGPDRNTTGTGFGGVFGASYRLFGPLIFNIVQGQVDTRDRYRVTSGLQYLWTPSSSGSVQQQKREEVTMARLTGLGGAASSAGG